MKKQYIVLFILLNIILMTDVQHRWTYYGGEIECFVEEMASNNMMFVNDSAHFKYYENDSHIIHWYEWWYVNLKGDKASMMLQFFTFGNLNNPASSLVGVVAFVFNESESIESITAYPFIDYELDYRKCNVTIAGNRFYEENGIYHIYYEKEGLRISMRVEGDGKPFGNSSRIDNWQWMAWYVAVPYGKGEAEVFYKGKKLHVEGIAYHDHNWGIAKKNLKWDWGEFCSGNFSVIYGFLHGAQDGGGIHFVNESKHVFMHAEIEFLEWRRMWVKKPVKIRIYGNEFDFTVELKTAFIIGYKNFGLPYLLGKAVGYIKMDGHKYIINAIGFYEHHS